MPATLLTDVIRRGEIRAEELFLRAVAQGKIKSFLCDVMYDMAFLNEHNTVGNRFIWGISEGGTGTYIALKPGNAPSLVTKQNTAYICDVCSEVYELTLIAVKEYRDSYPSHIVKVTEYELPEGWA